MDKNLKKALSDKQKEADRVKKILQKKKEKAAQKATAQAPKGKENE
jgi:hypothetical protein